MKQTLLTMFMIFLALPSWGSDLQNAINETFPNQIKVYGVKIIGNTNLPGELPVHSSQVYASNIYNLIEEFWDEETKELTLDEKDEILSICLVSHKKEYINPTIKEIMQ